MKTGSPWLTSTAPLLPELSSPDVTLGHASWHAFPVGASSMGDVLGSGMTVVGVLVIIQRPVVQFIMVVYVHEIITSLASMAANMRVSTVNCGSLTSVWLRCSPTLSMRFKQDEQ